MAVYTAIDLALPDAAKRLLGSGMDFDLYTDWLGQAKSLSFGALQKSRR